MGVANCNCNITDEELINDINSSMLSSSQIDRISTLFKVLLTIERFVCVP